MTERKIELRKIRRQITEFKTKLLKKETFIDFDLLVEILEAMTHELEAIWSELRSQK